MSEPAAVEVTSQEIKAVAVAVGGLNEAARKLGLKPATVRQRCKREGWMSDAEFRGAIAQAERKQGKTPERAKQPATLTATATPAQAMIAEMRELNGKSRLNMARGLHAASEHIAGMDGQEIVEDAANVKQTAQSLDLVHGWREQAPTAKLAIHVIAGAPIPPAEQFGAFDAEWRDAEPAQLTDGR